MITDRSIIRRYLLTLLKQKVNVGERVFLNRDLDNSPLTLAELPTVLIQIENEFVGNLQGSEFLSLERQHNLEIVIMPVVGGTNIEALFDQVDLLEHSILRAFYDDYRLCSLLPDYNANIDYNEGLSLGHQIKNIKPYIVITNAEFVIVSNVIDMVIPYHMHNWSEEKLDYFETFGLEVIPQGEN